MVDQRLDLQLAPHAVEAEAPLLQFRVDGVVRLRLAACQHLVLLRPYLADADASTKTVVDVAAVELLRQRHGRTRDDLVPEHLYHVVHRVVVGIVHAAELVVERLQLQVVLACPVALLCAYGRVQFRVEHIEVQVHQFAPDILLGVFTPAEEYGVRRFRGQVTNDLSRHLKRFALLRFRRRRAFLQLPLVLLLGFTPWGIGGFHGCHNLTVETVNEALACGRRTDEHRRRVQPRQVAVVVLVPAARHQRAEHGTAGEDSRQQVRLGRSLSCPRIGFRQQRTQTVVEATEHL